MLLKRCLMLKNVLKRTFPNVKVINIRKFSQSCKILGIETSCDDTGCAVVDHNGNILGEAIHSQQNVHLSLGGIIPPLAQTMHRENIERIVSEAMNNAKVGFNDIDAIAVTTEPGLPMSLVIGSKYGKYLCRLHKKPFIPIHHMKAHALTARMFEKSVEYPFLVLLISGGHCLLAVAKNADDFQLLGQTMDDSPGEAFDKTARRLKLRNIPEFVNMSGGQAIETAASRAENYLEFPFTIPMSKYKDCNFSISGLKNKVLRHIIREEKKYGTEPDEVIPSINNLCASFQLAMARHLCHRTQRAMEFISRKNLLPDDKKTLVVSGGAACNNFIASALKLVCDEYQYKIVRPPSKLCTDNGVMIAWNGVEKWQTQNGILIDLDQIEISSQSPIGVDISQEVAAENISCNWVKLTSLVKKQS